MIDIDKLLWYAMDLMFEDNLMQILSCFLFEYSNSNIEEIVLMNFIPQLNRNPYHCILYAEQENSWIDHYNEYVFFKLFRMKKDTFEELLKVLIECDQHKLIKKKYRGGNRPITPEKGLLIFLWYISKPDGLITAAEVFHVVPSTVLQITNNFLYLLKSIKNKYIFWPQSRREYEEVRQGFRNYPGVIGAVDGCHVKLKVPVAQHDSYVDRYMSHSINLMAICTSNKIFTYIFVGYPGSAHDSRVFMNSGLVRAIEQGRLRSYFPNDECHIIGDSAFTLSSWLMKPYRNATTVKEKRHNYMLSADRVCIEHTFGLLKGRWRRLQFINTYAISKAVEIVIAACVLHNFCYIHNDLCDDTYIEEDDDDYDAREEHNLGIAKRDRIADNFTL